MIISPGRRYVFVHIPKTGGTALSLALEARAMKDDILVGDTPKAQRRKGRLAGLTPAGRLWKHSTLADVAGVVDPEGMCVVTLVRNPWDRMVSYYHWLRGQTFAHPAVALAQRVDFAGFLADAQTQSSISAHPAASYTRDAAGVDRCTVAARLEHWRDDLQPFLGHLGFDVEIGVVNASDRVRDWRGYYSEAEAALVGRLCGEDITRFNYRFDPD